jgi:hypothetical protein
MAVVKRELFFLFLVSRGGHESRETTTHVCVCRAAYKLDIPGQR